MPRKLSLLLHCLFFFSCTRETTRQEAATAAHPQVTSQAHAERFIVEKRKGALLVHLFGNRDDKKDTTATFVLRRDTASSRGFPSHYQAVKIPCRKVAALSSIYASMLDELGALDAVAAIDNIDYVINPSIRQKYERGQLKELAKSPQIDLEQTVALAPDVVFTYGMGYGEELNHKLLSTKIPIAVSLDHLEETPLARAEWIKFFAVFVDRSSEADSIFRYVERNYLELRKAAASFTLKPTVFSELKFGDVWYMPGGKSYMARLMHDAGGDYLWKNDHHSGSLQLSFEQVYARARDATFWLNLSMVNSREELLGHDRRYAEFRAFREGNLYNNNKVTNSKGYSVYWETGMYHPERILHDLIRIFHDPAEARVRNDLYYYRQIK